MKFEILASAILLFATVQGSAVPEPEPLVGQVGSVLGLVNGLFALKNNLNPLSSSSIVSKSKSASASIVIINQNLAATPTAIPQEKNLWAEVKLSSSVKPEYLISVSGNHTVTLHASRIHKSTLSTVVLSKTTTIPVKA